MTSFSAVAQPAKVSGFSLTAEIGLPWRLMAFGIVMFGAGDVVAREGAGGLGTVLFFASYGLLAAGFTLLFTRKGR